MAIKADPATARKYLALAGKLVGSVCLPPPPSTNEMYALLVINGFARRVAATKYKRWQKEADRIAVALRSPAAYPCHVHICCLGKWYRQRDLDNLLKPTLDTLKRCGVIQDDNLARIGQLSVTQERSEAPPLLRVSIEEMAPGLFG